MNNRFKSRHAFLLFLKSSPTQTFLDFDTFQKHTSCFLEATWQQGSIHFKLGIKLTSCHLCYWLGYNHNGELKNQCLEIKLSLLDPFLVTHTITGNLM